MKLVSTVHKSMSLSKSGYCKVTLGTTLFSQQSYDAAAKPLFFSTFALNFISKSIFDNKNPAIVQKSNNYIQFLSNKSQINHTV